MGTEVKITARRIHLLRGDNILATFNDPSMTYQENCDTAAEMAKRWNEWPQLKEDSETLEQAESDAEDRRWD